MGALKAFTQAMSGATAVALCVSALLLSPIAQAETAQLKHDATGNITERSITQGTTTQTTTYQYDALNRLTDEAGPAKTQHIDYDENGNRKSDGTGTYSIEPASNRMSTRLGLSVSYDAAGNLTADGTGKTYTYTPLGQLYQVFQGGILLATYEYDGTGLRLSKTTTASAPQGAQTVVYIHDQWGKLIEEFTGTGGLIRSYIWREDAPVAQIEHTASGDKILYFEVDHLNTPRVAMGESGKVVWRWESDAFGSTLPDEDPDKDGNKTTVNLRFPGQYYDQESGLHYNYFRDYDPATGRYVQSDPIGLRSGINTYAYVGGNPLSFTDPKGLCIEDACIVEGAVVGAFIRWAIPRVAAAIAGASIANSSSKSGSASSSSTSSTAGEQCKPDNKKPNCRKASPWDLKQAGITDEHAYKTEHGAVPWSRFDICKCNDGTIRIAKVGQCGKTTDFWD